MPRNLETRVSEDKFQKNMMQLGAGIETCLQQRLITPALVLLYSAIDITSWLAADAPTTPVRESFTAWVNRYLLSAKPLRCTALDLYSARCGLVHTLTPDSRLVQQGKCRQIAYAWGTTNSGDLDELIARTNWSSKLVAVHVEELYEAWRLGLLAFTEELENNPEKAAVVYERATKFFANLAAEPFESLVRGGETKDV